MSFQSYPSIPDSLFLEISKVVAKLVVNFLSNMNENIRKFARNYYGFAYTLCTETICSRPELLGIVCSKTWKKFSKTSNNFFLDFSRFGLSKFLLHTYTFYNFKIAITAKISQIDTWFKNNFFSIWTSEHSLSRFGMTKKMLMCGTILSQLGGRLVFFVNT